MGNLIYITSLFTSRLHCQKRGLTGRRKFEYDSLFFMVDIFSFKKELRNIISFPES